MVSQMTLDLENRKPYICAQQIEGTWVLTGETYVRRRTLLAAGGKWDAKLKTWKFDDPLPGVVIEVITDWKKYEEQPTQEPQQAPQEEPLTLPSWFTPPSWWPLIGIYIQHRPAIAVVGPAGNGKTTTVEQALAALNMPFVSISCTDRTEVVELTGGTILTASGEEWRDGQVTQAFRNGWAVVLDEADALDPRVMLALQNALQDAGPDGKARYINTPGGRVYPAAACPIILCMNTYGEGGSRTYNGRNKLDAASMDRFTVLSTTYENEEAIIKARGYSARTANGLVNWANDMRRKIAEAGMTIPLSPRTLLRMAQAVDTFGWSFEIASQVEFFSRMDQERAALLKGAK